MGIEDIIILAEKQGVNTISITDHDCMAGNIRAKVIGDRHGVSIIHGVEISATDSTQKIPAPPVTFDGTIGSPLVMTSRS